MGGYLFPKHNLTFLTKYTRL